MTAINHATHGVVAITISDDDVKSTEGEEHTEGGGEGDDDPQSQCRFCLEEDGALVRPCKCTGTQAHVHPHCLQTWLQTAPTQTSRTTCQTCHHKYSVVIAYRQTLCERYIRRCYMEPVTLMIPLQFVAFWVGYCINLITCRPLCEDASVILADWPHSYAVGSTVAMVFAMLVACASYIRMPRPRAPCRQFICAPHRDLMCICLVFVLISVSIGEPLLLRFATYLISAMLLAGAVHMPSALSTTDRDVIMTFGEYETMSD